MLWGLLLLLIGAGFVGRRLGARFWALAIFVFAFLTAALSVSIFYGCSTTAASEQGLGSDLPAGTYTFLHCLGWNALEKAVGWAVLAISSVAAIGLLVIAVRRRRMAVRVAASVGAVVLSIVSLFSVLLLLLDFSWCTSQRLF